PSAVEIVRDDQLDDPGDPTTFERCKIDGRERGSHAAMYALHRDLLRIRREDAAFRQPQRGSVDGCVLSAHAFALRFFTPDHLDDRVLIVNLGCDIDRPSIAEPLLAPPQRADWALHWSSEDSAYDGTGTPELWPDRCWKVPGESAVVLRPGPRRP